MPDLLIDPVVRAALAEDLGRAGDITSAACIDADAASPPLRRRRAGVVAGLACARLAIAALDPAATFDAPRRGRPRRRAGRPARPRRGQRPRPAVGRAGGAQPAGPALSGVASLTRAYVDAVAGTGATIIDTRKTTPGLRALEKYAVRCGGGVNHRFGLDDAILIKDNHVAACGGVGAAIRRARGLAGHLVKIEAEVDSLASSTRRSRPDRTWSCWTTSPCADLRVAVARAKGRVTLEASGGVSLETVRAIAETGVDVISVGALTHSAPVLDIGLDAD